jgi:peptidoglycan hydrolase-like protein with peptidoglycan-binding domain
MPLPRLTRPHSGRPLPAPDALLSDDGFGPPPRRRRLRRWIALATVVSAGAAIAVVVAIDSGGHGPSNNSEGIPVGDTTAAVERRTLVEHAQLNGTLTYSSGSDIYDRLAGTFTWLPAAGAVIHRGQQLFRINNTPVVLMYGSLPAYRALKEGVSDGPDVAELNENVIALGYDPYGAIGTREDFSAATTAAVKRWQQAEGLPQTGQVELGRVVFAAGARRVTSLHVTLGEDPPAASEEAAPKQKQEEEAASKRREEAAAAKRREEATAKRKAEAEARRRHKKAASHNKSPSESSSHNKDGAGANKEKQGSGNNNKEKESSGANKEKESSNSPAAAQPKLALSTTGRQQIVQLQVKANQQQLAHVGERTNVTLPDGSVVAGHITSVGTVATESSENEHGGGGSGGNGENATVAVTLALDRTVSHLDKAPVSVELVKNVRRNVPAVPATALVALAGGGYAVQALQGNRRVRLPVTTGMFAGGYVEVEGAGLREGLTVLVPQ